MPGLDGPLLSFGSGRSTSGTALTDSQSRKLASLTASPIDAGATGLGTEASPYVGGVQSLINSVAAGRGGDVLLPAGRFDPASALTITTPNVRVIGQGGFNVDPNGESEGAAGTKIRPASGQSAFTVGQAGAKLGNVQLRSLYLWGPGKGTAAGAYDGEVAGVRVNNQVDHMLIRDLSISNFTHAILFKGSACVDDTTVIERNAILNNFHGITYHGTGSAATYGKIAMNNIADNDGIGILMVAGTFRFGLVITANEIIRNGRAAGVGGASNAYLGIPRIVFTSNVVRDAGRTASTNGLVAADGVVVAANGITVSGNVIEDNASGAGVRVMSGAVGTTISGNTLSGNLTNILIEAGATDTVIDQPGIPYDSINDSGTRTIFNGLSFNEGDPDTTGAWNGVPKPSGLLIFDRVGKILWHYHPGFNISGSPRVRIGATAS